MPSSLRLYLDDCADSRRLCTALRTGGLDVTRPRDAKLTGARDRDHFAYARANGLVLVTANPRDFEMLHQQAGDHAGIFAIYQDNDRRDMTVEDIVRAIQNLIDAAAPLAGQFITLNHWRY